MSIFNVKADNVFNDVNSYIISDGMVLNVSDRVKNAGKIQSYGDLDVRADFIDNYGQLMSLGDMTLTAKYDYIGYRGSGALSAGDININTGRNYINYMAEMFAMGDIEISGLESGVNITGSPVDLAKAYDNPYLELEDINTPPPTITPPVLPDPVEHDEEDSFIIKLIDNEEMLVVDAGTFPDEPDAGYSVVIDGYTVIYGVPQLDESGNLEFDEGGNPVYIIDDDRDEFTVLGSDGTFYEYAFFYDNDDITDNPDEGLDSAPGIGMYENDLLDSFNTVRDYTGNNKQSNSIQNIGGRIESEGNITINTDQLFNIGIDFDGGTDGYKTTRQFYRNHDMIGWDNNWHLFERTEITETYFDSIGAQIIAHGDINIDSRRILNQSSEIAARNDINIKAGELHNITSYYTVWLDELWGRKRKYRNDIGRKRKKYYKEARWYTENIYSHSQSSIIAGNTLSIISKELKNNQQENPIGPFAFTGHTWDTGKDKWESSGINVQINLPEGNNGLFQVTVDGAYLVQQNGILDISRYIGGEYFFGLTGDVDHLKLFGDPAYETRLVMDAIRKSTYQHYLTNDGSFSSDLDQMKALYDNALTEKDRLNLTVGIALTESQIASLTSDVIWYVESVVAGQKVLVPQLYLCPQTIASISAGGSTAKIAGKNVNIKADDVYNAGDILASNNIKIDAKNLTNQSTLRNQATIAAGNNVVIDAGVVKNYSGSISGNNVLIEADEVFNVTQVYTQDRRFGTNTIDIDQEAGYIATIHGDNSVIIDTGIFASAGGALSGGDILIDADTAVFSTVEVTDERKTKTKYRVSLGASKKVETHSVTTTNIGSTVDASGTFQLVTSDDAKFYGSTVNANDALLDIGGGLTIGYVYDVNYDYIKEDKTSLWKLRGKGKENEDDTKTVVGSEFNINNNLTMVSGGNTYLTGSILNAKDTSIYTGHQLNGDGTLSGTDTGGSFYMENVYDVYSGEHSSYKYKTGFELDNFVRGLANGLLVSSVVSGAGAIIGQGIDSVPFAAPAMLGQVSDAELSLLTHLGENGIKGGIAAGTSTIPIVGDAASIDYTIDSTLLAWEAVSSEAVITQLGINAVGGATTIGASAGPVLNLGIGLMDGLTFKGKSHYDKGTTTTAVQSQINTENLTIVSAKDVVIQGKIDTQNKADILGGFTQNQDGTLTQNAKGSVVIVSDTNTSTGYDKDTKFKVDFDTHSPRLDGELKASGSYAESNHDLGSFVQTTISAKELNITASEDIVAYGAGFNAKSVDLTAVSGNVRLETHQIVSKTDSTGANITASADINLLKGALNMGDVMDAMSENLIEEMIDGLGRSELIGMVDLEVDASYDQLIQVTNIGTTINADNINISAGKDVSIIGGSLDGTNINIAAKDDVLIHSSQDVALVVDAKADAKGSVNPEGLAGTVDVDAQGTANISMTNNQSVIKGENITITAKDNLYIVGSDIDGSGNVKLEAEDNLLVAVSYDLGIAMGVNADGKIIINKEALKNAMSGDMESAAESLGEATEVNISPNVSGSIQSNSSSVTGNNVDISAGRSTTVVSSDIHAKNDMNIDAGKVLTMLGLPDGAGSGAGIDIAIVNVDGEYKIMASVSSDAYISEANRSSITAGGEINGSADYVIISLNGDIESSKGVGAENNFDKGSILPIVIEKDVNIGVSFSGDSSPRDITDDVHEIKDIAENISAADNIVDYINVAKDVIEYLKSKGAI